MALGFERGINRDTLGVGMKNKYEEWMKKQSINGTVSDKCELDIEGSIYFDGYRNPNFSEEEINFKYGRVVGSFIYYNTSIKTLDNAPNMVGRSFICINNKKIESINKLPKQVDGDFIFYEIPMSGK